MSDADEASGSSRGSYEDYVPPPEAAHWAAAVTAAAASGDALDAAAVARDARLAIEAADEAGAARHARGSRPPVGAAVRRPRLPRAIPRRQRDLPQRTTPFLPQATTRASSGSYAA